jgi:PKD repeat protein
MKPVLRSLLLAASMLLMVPTLALAQGATPSASAPSARPQLAKRPFPQMNLPERRAQGQRAIDVLGERLSEVAEWYGKSPDEFRSMLLRDRRLKIDQRGRLLVEEELDAPLPAEPPPSPGPSVPKPASSAPGAASGSLTGALAPLDQTFFLHSRPGAARTIYVNFRGAQLGGTAWNGSGSTVNALPFDLDGIPYSFTAAELERIQYIWQRVAEDFAPFDVDVTTEPPAAERLTRSGSSDTVFGTTVLVTSRSGVYSCSCGGVAYIGIFDDTSDFYKPALVFYDALGAGNERYVAEAVSHEAGHNMGLLHDGFSGGGYYSGHGSGATGWAPIMGVGYYQPLVQWSKGEYATANNVQDDYVVMAGNGLPLRADDHGNTIGAATPLVGSSAGGITTLSSEGVVERPSDIDWFSFASSAGAISFSVSPAARSANVDLLIELRDGIGNLLASANPVDALPATISHVAPLAGTFYLTVRGVGKGDPANGGYSNYGSVGQYAVSGSVPSASGQAPVASASASPTSGTAPLTSNFSGAGSYDPDGSIVAYEWNFGDGSAVAAGATVSHVYANAGSYAAQLKITDNSGLSTTRSVAISVQPAVVAKTVRVADIAMSLDVSRNGSAGATAAVAVRDATGNVVPGATVAGRWSGIVSRNVTAVSGSDGVARLQSPRTRSSGTFVFTVTGVSLSGYSYQSTLNVESSDSITR